MVVVVELRPGLVVVVVVVVELRQGLHRQRQVMGLSWASSGATLVGTFSGMLHHLGGVAAGQLGLGAKKNLRQRQELRQGLHGQR